MSLLPKTIDFNSAFLAAFDHVVEAGYSILSEAEAGEDDLDADDVRVQLDSAIGETVSAIGVDLNDAPEVMAELHALLADSWPGLFAFIDSTSDR